MNRLCKVLAVLAAALMLTSCASLDRSRMIPKVTAPFVKAKTWVADRVHWDRVHWDRAPIPSPLPRPILETPEAPPTPPPKPAPVKPDPAPLPIKPPTPTYAERALDAYKRFRYDEVLRIVEGMDAGDPPEREDRATAYLVAGAVMELKGHSVFARWHFGRARHLAPGLRPNVAFFPQSVLDAYEKSPPRNPNPPRVAPVDLLVPDAKDSEPPAAPGVSPNTRPAPEIQIQRGEASLKTGEEFCFSLNQKVTAGGDIGWLRGNGRDAGSLKTPGGALAMGSGALVDLLVLPEHQPYSLSDALLRRDKSGETYASPMRVIVGQRYALLCADGVTYAAIRITGLTQDAEGKTAGLAFQWRYAQGSRYLGR